MQAFLTSGSRIYIECKSIVHHGHKAEFFTGGEYGVDMARKLEGVRVDVGLRECALGGVEGKVGEEGVEREGRRGGCMGQREWRRGGWEGAREWRDGGVGVEGEGGDEGVKG